MKLIFIGESIKTIDRLSGNTLLNEYPSIPWHDIMAMRDVIVHHYLEMDAEIVFATIKNDLPVLDKVLH